MESNASWAANGRIDRIGQKQPKILIWNPKTQLMTESTTGCLRLETFTRALGDMEMILGQEIRLTPVWSTKPQALKEQNNSGSTKLHRQLRIRGRTKSVQKPSCRTDSTVITSTKLKQQMKCAGLLMDGPYDVYPRRIKRPVPDKLVEKSLNHSLISA